MTVMDMAFPPKLVVDNGKLSRYTLLTMKKKAK